VASVERLCDDAAAITFTVPNHQREVFAFRPGQYLTFRRWTDKGEQRRSYSICAPAGGPLRVGVRRVAAGLFSPWLVDQLQPGEEVEVAPPAGRFTPELTSGAHHGLIAAGAGITPVLSIAASVLASSVSSRVTLLYGNRRTDTVMFSEELSDLKNVYPARLHLIHVLSREPAAVEVFFGRLDAARLHMLLTTLVDVEDVNEWWLCGPLGMALDAAEVLAGLGVAGTRVHRELFYVDEPPPERSGPAGSADSAVIDEESGEMSEVTVMLHGRATTLRLSKSQSVLDGAQRVRGDLPFACKGGVCGTCRAKVTDGQVVMRRNFALEDDELSAGYVLTCQGRANSATVTVDYDI